MTILDARGLLCPLPLTLTRQRMAELVTGERLTVLATDPEAPLDLAAWAAVEGHGFSGRRLDAWSELTLTKGAGTDTLSKPGPPDSD